MFVLRFRTNLYIFGDFWKIPQPQNADENRPKNDEFLANSCGKVGSHQKNGRIADRGFLFSHKSPIRPV